MHSEANTRFMDTLSGLLIRCFFITVVMMIIWVIVYFIAGGIVFHIQSKMFGLSKIHFELINYCAMTAVKIIAFVFFLTPYLAIKLLQLDMERTKHD